MQRKDIILATLFLFSVVLIVGCYKDKEEVLYPNNSCDTSGTVSFKNQIVPIISGNCYGCHSNSTQANSGINLEGYNNFVVATQNGLLLKAIKHEAGVSAMPKNGSKLSNCNITIIEKWINEGKMDN